MIPELNDNPLTIDSFLYGHFNTWTLADISGFWSEGDAVVLGAAAYAAKDRSDVENVCLAAEKLMDADTSKFLEVGTSVLAVLRERVYDFKEFRDLAGDLVEGFRANVGKRLGITDKEI